MISNLVAHSLQEGFMEKHHFSRFQIPTKLSLNDYVSVHFCDKSPAISSERLQFYESKTCNT